MSLAAIRLARLTATRHRMSFVRISVLRTTSDELGILLTKCNSFRDQTYATSSLKAASQPCAVGTQSIYLNRVLLARLFSLSFCIDGEITLWVKDAFSRAAETQQRSHSIPSAKRWRPTFSGVLFVIPEPAGPVQEIWSRLFLDHSRSMGWLHAADEDYRIHVGSFVTNPSSCRIESQAIFALTGYVAQQ
jgi:hypothetical protein